MKRLLKISLDTLISSFSSILIWFILSIFVDKNLITIFVLTYPIQYIASSLKAIFATGANISHEKGNINDVLSGLTSGIIASIIVTIIIIFNLKTYTSFMGINIDNEFVIYSVIQIFMQAILNFVLIKLYYENKNTLANIYSTIFYLINLLSIFILSLSFKNVNFIIIPTLIFLGIFLIYIIVKSYKKFIFKFNLLKWIKYSSVDLSNNIFLGLGFLFGLNIAINFGKEYVLAMNFVALITDTQWDITDAIETVAKIDISRNKFNYKEHFKNAYKLVYILIASIITMFIIFNNFYDLNLMIVIIYLLFHVADLLMCPIFKIDTIYLQLEYSTIKTTSINLSSRFLRMLISFLKTPYCNVIAQVSTSAYLTIIVNALLKKHFIISKEGKISRLK